MDDLIQRARAIPSVRADLEDLVRIESVWADQARRDEVHRSADAVARLLRDAGFNDVEIVRGRCSGRHRASSAPPGAPTDAVRPSRCSAGRRPQPVGFTAV